MEINENLTEVLNDLIRINNDRIAGYKRAADEAHDHDADLKSIFHKMADESRQYNMELTREVVKLGAEPATGTTASGKIYRAWMDVKATFTGSDREALLSSCEFGEDAAQNAYQEALTSDETLSIDIRQLIANQKASLQISHDTIKKYRDMHKNDNANSVRNDDSLTGSAGMSGATNSSLSGTSSASGYGSTSRSGSLGNREGLSDSDDLGGSGDAGNAGDLRRNI